MMYLVTDALVHVVLDYLYKHVIYALTVHMITVFKSVSSACRIRSA